MKSIKSRPEFDFINSINTTKNNIIKDDELREKEYVPFFINKSLSYTSDTLFHANEMNYRHFIPKKMQYDYLLYSVRKRSRFNKWHKKQEISNIDIIIAYYNVSRKRAEEYLSMLTKEQIKRICEIHGG
jgi:hypothetical protein